MSVRTDDAPQPALVQTVAKAFGEAGALAGTVAGFQPRPQQAALAAAVAEAIGRRELLVAEAGTGVGKTYAYLLPALASRLRVIVSTGTKTLQDQLFHKDLPQLLHTLELPLRVALLKGRSNYLCLLRLDQIEVDRRFDTPEVIADLAIIEAWAAVTGDGDRAEVEQVPAHRQVWSRVTSTVDNCLGQDCPFVADCHLLSARRRAQEADLVVVNHHLLMADLALKEDGQGEVLPDADVYVLDEAHQLPEVAAQFLGTGISSRQLQDLLRDLQLQALQEARDAPALLPALDAVRGALRHFRLALGEESRRQAWDGVIATDPAVREGLTALIGVLGDLAAALDPLAPRSRGLEQSLRRTLDAVARLSCFDPDSAPPTPAPASAAGSASADTGTAVGEAAAAPPGPEPGVRWFETRGPGFQLRVTPLDVGPAFRRYRDRHRASWVFTSATLSIAGDFSHFRGRLGLFGGTDLALDSPFDYRRQALLYTPRGMPQPASPDYDRAFLERAVEVLAITGGRAFLLFTSHRALRLACVALRERLDYPLLVQGEAGQHQLLERFRTLGNAVLLGTASFWEGVDVRGPALSAVLIDRLPFASPGDPVLEARIARIRERGGNPFLHHQLPLAVIALRQGVGRLIRGEADRGILMLADPRLHSRSYGKVFVSSLPAMPVTDQPDDLRRFMRADADACAQASDSG
jgi:ATP-dependent DNA helicase DinG